MTPYEEREAAEAEEFLLGRSRWQPIVVHPRPWSRVGDRHDAASILGVPVRVLVETGEGEGRRAVTFEPGASGGAWSFIVIRPGEGRLDLARLWGEGLRAAYEHALTRGHGPAREGRAPSAQPVWPNSVAQLRVRRRLPGYGGAHWPQGESARPEPVDSAEMQAERRAVPRASVGLWVDVLSVQQSVQSFCTDLSVEGLFLCGADSFRAGRLFIGCFELPGHAERIRALGEIVRTVSAEGPAPGCGARFVDICSPHRAAIAAFVGRTAGYGSGPPS